MKSRIILQANPLICLTYRNKKYKTASLKKYISCQLNRTKKIAFLFAYHNPLHSLPPRTSRLRNRRHHTAEACTCVTAVGCIWQCRNRTTWTKDQTRRQLQHIKSYLHVYKAVIFVQSTPSNCRGVHVRDRCRAHVAVSPQLTIKQRCKLVFPLIPRSALLYFTCILALPVKLFLDPCLTVFFC